MGNVENGRRENENQDHRPAHAAENVLRSRENGGTENGERWSRLRRTRNKIAAFRFDLGTLVLLVLPLAAVGQIELAKKRGAVGMIEPFGVDITPLFVPALFDVAVIVFLNSGLAAARNGRSPWRHWIVGFGLGCLSIYANTQHGGALIFASASGVLLLAYFLKLLDDYAEILRDQERTETPRPKITLLFWLAAFRTAWRAWIITIHHAEVNTPAQAKRMAKVWRDIYQDVCATPAYRITVVRKWTRPNRRLARRTAWDFVAGELHIPVIKRQGVVLATIEYAPTPPPAPIAAPRPPARPAITATPNQRPATPRPPASVPVSPAPAGPATPDVDVVAAIPGLEHVDLDGELHAKVSKDAHYILKVVEKLATEDRPDFAWARPDRIVPADVQAATGITGGATRQRIANNMNEVRAAMAVDGFADLHDSERK